MRARDRLRLTNRWSHEEPTLAETLARLSRWYDNTADDAMARIHNANRLHAKSKRIQRRRKQR
jgi:hypothetical protein